MCRARSLSSRCSAKSSPKDQEIYIDVLANAVRDWKPDESHEVVAAFDPTCELKLRAAARDS